MEVQKLMANSRSLVFKNISTLSHLTGGVDCITAKHKDTALLAWDFNLRPKTLQLWKPHKQMLRSHPRQLSRTPEEADVNPLCDIQFVREIMSMGQGYRMHSVKDNAV